MLISSELTRWALEQERLSERLMPRAVTTTASTACDSCSVKSICAISDGGLYGAQAQITDDQYGVSSRGGYLPGSK
ncbi:MAG: hypothetical protein ACLRM8_02140 [Alistipes sp.]